MLEEAKAMKQHFMNHMDNSSDPWYEYGKHQGWFSIDLHNMTDSKLYGHDDSIDPKVWKYVHDRAWTEASQQSPVTVDYFTHQFTPHTQYRRVRWMWLAPGGWIAPHVDHDQRCVDINIAVNNPDQCTFEYDDCTIPFQPGTAYILATHLRHAVYNRSDQWRLHIQINQGKDHTQWLDDVIADSYDRYHNTIYRSNQ